MSSLDERVWYVGYGSNLSRARFGCYLHGGRPAGGARTYPGCRDRSVPAEVAPVSVPGTIFFAGRSTVWGGGVAFFDPGADDRTAARAYLITRSQLADVMAQEMNRDPVADLDLTDWRIGADHVTGPGGYETLIALGERDRLPMVTLGHQDPDRGALNPPSAAYLRTLATGLQETHDWDADQIGDYLASRPGADLTWTAASVAELLSDADS